MKVTALIDWFIPEETFDDIVELSKSRIFVAVNILTPFIIIGNSFRAFIADKMMFGYVAIVISLILLGGPFIYRATRSILVGGYYFMLLCFLFMLFGIFDTGGVPSYFTVNLTLLVLLSYLMIGFRTGLFWGAVSIAALFVLQAMKSSGYPFPEVPVEDAFPNAVTIVGVIVLLGGIFERTSHKNLKRFVEEKNLSDDAAQLLKKVLNEVNVVMNAVSKGDLSKKIQMNVDGELSILKESVNNSITMLGKTMDQVLQVSYQINSGTQELSDAVQLLANGNIKQAASIEEISSSMGEIGSRAKTNKENASQAQGLSNQTANEARNGNEQMQSMLKSMNKINETSSNVSKVIKAIDEIAFQTNLLALNAAVEAARAGKYGKGFAVVAEEVRNLAVRSAEAAKDTTNLIESSIVEVGNGVKNADQTAEILKGFLENIDKVNDFVGEIAMASTEQSSGVDEINSGLSMVNEVVQQNSSVSEESASASQELSKQADILKNLMNSFTLSGRSQSEIYGKQVKSTKTKRLPEISAPKPPPARPQLETKKPSGDRSQKSKQSQIILDDDDFGKY